jgi:hypothetical protein
MDKHLMGASLKSHFYRLGLDMGNLQKLGVVLGAQGKFPPRGLNLIDWTDQFSNFSDAPFVADLDLIITLDRSVAHLAGALGPPVWVMLQFVPDWRWLLDGQRLVSLHAIVPPARQGRLGYRQQTGGRCTGLLDREAPELPESLMPCRCPFL